MTNNGCQPLLGTCTAHPPAPQPPFHQRPSSAHILEHRRQFHSSAGCAEQEVLPPRPHHQELLRMRLLSEFETATVGSGPDSGGTSVVHLPHRVYHLELLANKYKVFLVQKNSDEHHNINY